MSTQRLLVIDDDPNIRNLCHRILAKEYDVQSATSCAQGRELLGMLRFDLVLLDLNLPDGQGLDVLRSIRESNQEIPVIVITGHGTMQVVIDALHSGAQGFLIKPFAPFDLRRAVERVLEQQQLRAENARLAARLPLLEISKALMSETNPERLAQLVLDTVQRELAADRVSLMLLDDEGQNLTIAAAVGLDEEIISEVKILRGTSLAGHVAQTGQAVVIPGDGLGRPPVPESMLRGIPGSALCVPLLYRGDTIGVLNASRPSGAASFTQDDLDLTLILGGQIAVALENARLFEQAAYEIAERKATEEALRVSEARYRTLFETADDAIFILADGRILTNNPKTEEMFGYTKEQLRGQLPQMLSPKTQPNGRDSNEWGAELVLQTQAGYPQRFDWQHQRADGTLFDVEVSLNRIDIAGQEYVQAIVRDITERLQTAEALRRERDFVAAITDTVGALVVVLDDEGHILRFNQACEQTTGYAFAEVKGKHVWDLLLPPKGVEPVKTVFGELRAGRFPGHYENEWITKDGERRLIAWTNTALTDGEGTVEYVIGTGIDITERRHAQEALQASEDRYRFLFESASVSLWEEDIGPLRRALDDLKSQGVTDLGRYLDENPDFFRQAAAMIEILDVNETTVRMLGTDDKTPFLGPLIDTMSPEAIPTLREDIIAIAEGRPYFEKESTAQTMHGVHMDTVIMSSIPEPNALHGTMIVGMLDVTQRKQAEEALRRSTERLGILHEIDQGILAARSPDAIADATLSKVRQLIPCQRATISVIDPISDESITLAVDTDRETAVLPGTRVSHAAINDQIAGLGEGRIAWWNVPLDQGGAFAQVYAEGIRTFASVPLLVQDQLIGTLNLGLADRETFTDEHTEIAFQIADQLAIAIQQARLYEQVESHAQELEQRVKERTAELQAMYDVIAIASQPLDLDAVLDQSLKRVLKATGSAIGSIHLLDSSGETLRLTASQGIPQELGTQLAELPIDEGLVSRVITQGHALVLPDISTEPLLAHASVPGPLAYVGVPMDANGRTLGVLSILWETTQAPLGLEVIALITSLTSRVASVVESSQLRLLAEQGAVLRERQRLARELHDSVTQSLYSLNLLATTGQRALAENDTERVGRYFGWMSETSQQALKEMRLLIYELRPPVLEQDGLVSALQQRLDAVEGRAGVETRLIVEGDDQVPMWCEEAFYRIAMEALNNALKHAEATAVTIELTLQECLVELRITDNGQGFDLGRAEDSGGMGLAVMQERADEISADLQVASEPGQGTQITVSVSCEQ